VNKKQQRTLETVFEDPIKASIAWKDIEALFAALGAETTEGSGSRVRVALHGVRAIFHRPHPQKEIHRSAIKSVRRFLQEAGITP
jgi:hypothetical protein